MKKVVMITGGARGLGKKLVEDFLKNDYLVSFSYYESEKEAKKLCEKYGDRVLATKINFENLKGIDSFVTNTMNKFGRIDILVNNAATTNDSLFFEKNSETFERVLRVNLVGVFELSKVVGEIMYKEKCGKIINITSTNGINTYFPMCLEYDASKSALISLTHNLAVQFAPYVNVNAVAPGFIKTESEIKDMDETFIKQEEEKILLKRAGEEEDVANLVLFLASEKSNFINNQVIKINGGMYGDC